MNFDEAMSEAVQGARVTCDYLGAGVYVDYQFSGWRINQPNGMASSGFGFRDEHKAQEWRIVCNEHSWVEGAEGAFAGFTHHCSLCGVEGNPEVPKPKPKVWGRPRIALGEAGVPQPERIQAQFGGMREGKTDAARMASGVPEDAKLYASTKGGGKSYSGNINRDFGKMASGVPNEVRIGGELVGTIKSIEISYDGVTPFEQAKRIADRRNALHVQQTGRATRPNVGTAAPPSGLALARLERAKAAEPLPTPDKPARPWGAPAAKPWGPGK